MAKLEPKKINLDVINGGNRYENGDGVTPESINAPIEASAYAQGVADTAKNTADNAITTSNNALNVANGIDGKATEALTKSGQAVTTANGAVTTAQEALDTVNKKQGSKIYIKSGDIPNEFISEIILEKVMEA